MNKKNLKDETLKTYFDENNRPNLTPTEIFELGSFIDQGGYWRPINSCFYEGELTNEHEEFKQNIFAGIEEHLFINKEKDYKNFNRYGVKCGSSLEMWQNSGWITKHDPYGWVQWYCRFFCRQNYPSYNFIPVGTNLEQEKEDARQIKRWEKFAGKNGRFRINLMNQIISKNSKYNDFSISPAIRQNLQHWGYKLTRKDLLEFKKTKKRELNNNR